MIRRSLLLLPLAMVPEAVSGRKRRKKTKKVLSICSSAGPAWDGPIAHAVQMVNDRLPRSVKLRFGKGCDIRFTLVGPAEMKNPGAWGEAEGRLVRLSTDAVPNPALICHELAHAIGHTSHDGGWPNERPCPFIYP